MRSMVHILCILALILIPVGMASALGEADLVALLPGGDDLKSVASETQAVPDGAFTIFVNRSRRSDEDALSLWCEFLAGNDVLSMSEDVTCTYVEGDEGADAFAESLRSRLPDGKMKVLKENPIVAISKAEAHRFDTLVLSNEMAAALDVSALLSDDAIEVVRR